MSLDSLFQFLGGVGLLLFALWVVEDNIRQLASGTFVRKFRAWTDKAWKGFLAGFGATAILQSSGLVSLLILSFASIGLLDLPHALWVMFGMNVGAPITDILLGIFGVKFDLATFALPFLAAGGIGMMLFHKHLRFQSWCKAIIGFGLLFVGLGWLKSGFAFLSSDVIFQSYTHLPLFLFFFGALLLTVLFQSSTVMIMLVLAAASQGAVSLPVGMVVIMAAFLGTTSTGLLGSFGTHALKKQIAWSHVLFNAFCVIVGLIIFPFLLWLFPHITSDLVFQLSIFAFGYRILGVLCMWPLLPGFVWLLHRLFPHRHVSLGLETESVDPSLGESTVNALGHDVRQLLTHTVAYMQSSLSLDIEGHLLQERYQKLKTIEERLIAYGLAIKAHGMVVDHYYEIVASTLLAAKYIKDIHQNIESLRFHDHDRLTTRYQELRILFDRVLEDFSAAIQDISSKRDISSSLHSLEDWDRELLDSSQEELVRSLPDLELSTIVHIHRALLLAAQSLADVLERVNLTFGKKQI